MLVERLVIKQARPNILKCIRSYILNIHIRPLRSVQTNLRFILHEQYDLSWPLSGRSLGKKHVLLRYKSTTLSNLVFYFDWFVVSVI